MTTITRESAEIKSFITGFLSDSAHDNQSSNSLLANVFRIALASLEAEPVAYQYRQWDAEYDEWGEWEGCGECAFERFVEEEKCQGAGVQTRKLYAAPPVSITPDGLISCSERMPDDGREQFEALVRFHAGDKNHETLLLRANEGMNYQDPNVDLAWIFWKSSREHI